MKQWNFKKQNYDCILTINDNANIQVQIDNNKPFNARNIDKGAVIFWVEKDMIIDGKKRKVGGFNLENYEEIKLYYEDLKNEIKDREKKSYDKEFSDLLDGKKSLEISFHDGEYWSGYTAYGISRDVIKYLHCGHDIGSGLFSIDKGFEDGNIDKMKKHFEEWKNEQERKEEELRLKKEKYEKEKQEFLDGVVWKVNEYFETDEGGRTKSYRHFITINGKMYIFCERNIFDFGRVINPDYEISDGIKGGLASYKDGKWIWEAFVEKYGWEKVRDMTEDEEHAFLIVQKYGYQSSQVRM